MNLPNPSDELNPLDLHGQVAAAVRSHRLKMRLLTSIAFIVGLVAVATAVVLVWSYLILYLPKYKQIARDAGATFARTHNAATETTPRDQLLGGQIALSHVTTVGVTILSVGVGILGLGTFTLALVVTLNRRLTLNQLQTSLAQISNQLRELQNPRASPPGAG